MPTSPRPSEIAGEAKRVWIPYITNYLWSCKDQGYTTGSKVYSESSEIDLAKCTRPYGRPAVAVVEGDPLDVALQWQDHASCTGKFCPMVNMANANKAGGDWEITTMGSEEEFARRSNLSQALRTPLGEYHPTSNNYPIPHAGGLFSPCVGKCAYELILAAIR
jgi:Uncharacterized protein conserved in bacteria (DUF2263)